MRLALRELRRRPGRFVTATVILALVAVLVMFLGGLLDGLIRGSTGALRAQDADLIVYSDTARSTFARSRIDADTRATIEGVDGVAETGGIGIVQLGARVPGNGPRDLAATALFGYELAPTGVPEPPARDSPRCGGAPPEHNEPRPRRGADRAAPCRSGRSS